MNTLLNTHLVKGIPHLSLVSFRPLCTYKPQISLSASSQFHSHSNAVSARIALSVSNSRAAMATKLQALSWRNEEERGDIGGELENFAPDSVVYQKTLRLVECSMFAAVAGMTYLLSSSLALDNYFACFFSFPIVLSSVRWGVAAGRKTMVATCVLLLVLSGPVKALTYLYLHGLVGLSIGSLWSIRSGWGLSVLLSAVVRAVGAIGYILTSSFLIRENFLALITINVHATLTYISNAVGLNAVPSMNFVYALFGTLLVINCVFFVFLLHILYAIFLARLGMKFSLLLPRWLDKALS